VVLGILISVAELTESSVAALKLQVAELGVIDAFVDGPEAIDLLEIIEVHPENTVIAIYKSNLISQFFRPERRLVRPVAVPFTTTPWVSELDETNGVAVDVEHLGGGKESVSVTWHDTLLLSKARIISVRHTATHHEVLLVVLEDLLEGVIIDSAEEVTWSTNKVSDCFILETSSDSVVAAVKLGPHLLEEDDPKFRSVRSRECDFVALARDEIINDNLHLDTILKHSCSVNAKLVGVFVQEHCPDSFGFLCDGGKRGKEVAITDLSLLDVVWLNITVEDT